MNFVGFKDYPDTSTPLNAAYMTTFLNAMYPIGKVEIFYDNEDHSNYLGFTWEKTLVGRTPIGADSTQTEFSEIGKQGGNKNHNHTLSGTAFALIGLNSYNNIVNQANEVPGYQYDYNCYAAVNRKYESGGTTAVTNLVGTTGNSNQLPPYEVVTFWKRVE